MTSANLGSRRFGLGFRNGAWRLRTPDGGDFFSLGVTHVLQILDQPVFRERYASDAKACAADVSRRLRSWGFNSLGYGSARRDCMEFACEMPFFASVEVLRSAPWLGATAAFDDVFDPAWRARAADSIRDAIGHLQGHPNLVGVCWSDLPCWGGTLGHPPVRWDDHIRSLPPDAPGKRAWISFLASRHTSFASWRSTAGARVASWDELAATRFWPESWASDSERSEFLAEMARQYYGLCHRVTRDLLPGTLVFGDRYHAGDLPACVLEAAAPFIDGVAIQPESGLVFDAERIRRASRIAGGKPVIVCDVAVNHPTLQHPLTVWPQAADEESAARAFDDYVRAACECGAVVGVHRCTYIDLVKPDGRMKQGLVAAMGVPHRFPAISKH